MASFRVRKTFEKKEVIITPEVEENGDEFQLEEGGICIEDDRPNDGISQYGRINLSDMDKPLTAPSASKSKPAPPKVITPSVASSFRVRQSKGSKFDSKFDRY